MSEKVYLDGDGYPYPLTIVSDRYGGVYSGGKFTAWNCESYGVPEGQAGCDLTCSDFWYDNTEIVGLGKTPVEAIEDLKNKLKGDNS